MRSTNVLARALRQYRARTMMSPYSRRPTHRAGWSRADVRGQWLPYLRLDLADELGRRRLIQWETRNLRMAAHLREATAEAPGGRVLMLVGSAHKPWLDAYLGRMHDIETVSAEEVLGPRAPERGPNASPPRLTGRTTTSPAPWDWVVAR